MGKRSLDYRKLKALEDERDLTPLISWSDSIKATFVNLGSQVPATLPEQMIWQYLVKLGVRFYYQYTLPDYPDTSFIESFTPDFFLPDYNIIIEVQGTYWHGSLSSIETDKMKAIIFGDYFKGTKGILPGYKQVFWDENEIYSNIDWLFVRDLPELLAGNVIHGKPQEYVFDAKEKRRSIESQKYSMIKYRIRPSVKSFKSSSYKHVMKPVTHRISGRNSPWTEFKKELKRYSKTSVKKFSYK